MNRLFLLLLLLPACTSKQERLSRRLEGNYKLGEPVSEVWKAVDPGGADYAWYSESLKASIYADSNCGIRYEDRPLWGLADSLLRGINHPKAVSEENFILDGREALLRVSEGDLDGVRVDVATAVFKKDACTYDFVLITSPASREAALPDFLSIVHGFKSQGAR